MTARAGDDRIHVRLMNDYMASFPLWTDEGQIDAWDLNLSDALRSDLESFAYRWEASIPHEVSDDRFDSIPIVRSLIDIWRSVRRQMDPAARRAAEAEDADLRQLGEELRDRLELELGAGFRVTYTH